MYGVYFVLRAGMAFVWTTEMDSVVVAILL